MTNAAVNTIRTTVNVRHDWCEKIVQYAASHRMRTETVIILLLKRKMKRIVRTMHYAERAMLYQERGCGYTPMHLSLSAVEYSRFRDVMLCCRFCLSLILGMAMESFDELMEPKAVSDSYPENDYQKLHIIINNIDIFVNSWGNPHKPPTE